MKPILRGQPVLDDLAEAYAWLAVDDVEVADRFLEAVARAFEQIQRHPAIGWSRPWKNRKLSGMRSWRVAGFENHLIFYREAPQTIQVYAVLHGARHLERVLRKR